MSDDVVVAVVSMHVAYDKQKNIVKYRNFIKQAARKKCRLLAFPECSLHGYTWTWDPITHVFHDTPEQLEYFRDNSETVPGPSTSLMCELASEHQMYIQFGLAEKVQEENGVKMFNTAVLVGPEGIIGKYHKVHMAPTPIFTPGDKFHVFHTEIGQVGIVICADMQQPESVRTVALKGAEIVVNSTGWSLRGKTLRGDYGGYRYHILGSAHAMMNQVWLLQSDQVGKPSLCTAPDYRYYGHSCIIDPTGRLVADTGYKEGMVAAKIRIKEGIKEAQSHKYTGYHPLLRRRPEAYE